jgi:hypothetical protein
VALCGSSEHIDTCSEGACCAGMTPDKDLILAPAKSKKLQFLSSRDHWNGLHREEQ